MVAGIAKYLYHKETRMSQLVAMFCNIDDFCNHFEPIYTQRLLQSGQRQRLRQSQLSLSEIMTIIVYFHASHYRNFKHYYTDYVAVHLRSEFPALVSYSRFVELMPRALVPLGSYLHTRKGRCTGITFVDSTPLAVCHNKRSHRHKVFADWASRGKCSMGWYFGFKLHLMVNDEGELLAFRVTTAEVDDREPVEQMAHELWGHLYGDRGYISKVLHDTLLAGGLKLITLIRRNMKPRLMRVWDRLMLRARSLIETVNDQLKNISQIEHSRHRSLTGFTVNLVGGLIAYTDQPTKPSLGLWRGESGLPVVV
jgi:Transposase DDE domain